MGKTLGEYLKHLRYNHPDRPSIREVARRAKIDVSYLSRMEKDEVSPPSEEILQRLASVLDVEDPDELLFARIYRHDIDTPFRNRKGSGWHCQRSRTGRVCNRWWRTCPWPL